MTSGKFISKSCSVEGCTKPHHSKGYCSTHYYAMRRRGTTETNVFIPNKYIVHDTYFAIILTDRLHRSIGETLIDKDKLAEVIKYRWHLSNGYAHNNKLGRLHRFLFPPPIGLEIDHINRNRADNRISNIRFVTRTQNTYNSSTRKTNSSGYKGVMKQGNSYTIQIQMDGKKVRESGFATAIEAAKAYNLLATKHHGIHAVLNTFDSE